MLQRMRARSDWQGIVMISLPAASLAHPDQELLAVCDQLATLQAEWQRLWTLTSDDDAVTTDADRAWEDYTDNVWPRIFNRPWDDAPKTEDVPHKLLALPATTWEGMRAKAAAILAMDQACCYTHDIRDDAFELMSSLLKDVAGPAIRPIGDEA